MISTISRWSLVLVSWSSHIGFHLERRYMTAHGWNVAGLAILDTAIARRTVTMRFPAYSASVFDKMIGELR